MTWIFVAFLGASVLHMAEEYVYPGGFLAMMKRLNPSVAPLITTPLAVAVNALQLLLCLVAVRAATAALSFSMSAAALLLINGLLHSAVAVRIRGYAPGVITGAVLYLPLALGAFYLFIRSGQLRPSDALVAGALGLIYQLVPISYLALARAVRRG